MKKFTKALTLLLIVAVTATLVACNTFGKGQKALEEIGYKAVETSNDTAEDMENESEVAVTVHLFSNAGSVSVAEIAKINTVIVFEFKATKDMIEYYKDSDTMQGLLKDIREEGSAEEPAAGPARRWLPYRQRRGRVRYSADPAVRYQGTGC